MGAWTGEGDVLLGISSEPLTYEPIAMRKLLVLLVVVGGGLFLTNPGMGDFQEFARARASDRIEEELGTGTWSELLGGAGGEFLANNVSRFTNRRTYLVCSLYSLDFDRDGRSNGRVLGVAGQFVVLDEITTED